jgi:Domain of unknown function (DUF222)
VVHVDVEQRAAALHLGPLLTESDRRYLTCDATCEVWFERAGQPIGAGRATRLISRRLRRALEYRHRSCAVPGCGATRGLHAHHIRHVRREARVFPIGGERPPMFGRHSGRIELRAAESCRDREGFGGKRP